MRRSPILSWNPAVRAVLAALFLLAAPVALSGCAPQTVADGRGRAQAPVVGPADGWELPPIPPDQTAATPLASAAGARTTVAVLLPLTGQHAPIGQAMLNAAQMAVFDVGGEDFELVPKDTRGTPAGAAAAASGAVQQGAQLILGPLLSTSVAAASDAVRGSGVNIIAFSNDSSVAGENVYVLGFLPEAEVRRVVGHARGQGMRRFAVLAPDSSYGRLVASSTETAVGQQGGVVTRVAFLSPGAEMEEVQRATEQIGGEPGRVRLQADVAVNRPFDALMLPMGGQQLSLTASLLQYSGIDPKSVRFLGTGQWASVPQLGAEPALVGGWFAAPEPEARDSFIARYAENYGAPPPRLATLAYDATTLAAALAGLPGRYDRSNLIETKGFFGADGLFRFRPDGTAERGLAVLEVTRDGVEVVDPAPQRFDDAFF